MEQREKEVTAAPAENGEKCNHCGETKQYIAPGIYLHPYKKGMGVCPYGIAERDNLPTAQPAEGERGIEDLLVSQGNHKYPGHDGVVEYTAWFGKALAADINRRITEAHRRRKGK